MELDIRKEAIKLFNETWDLFDKPERTEEEDITMLHKVHTSRYLWGLVGEPVNFARGEWQVSRAYALLKMGAPAWLHAQSSLKFAEENNLGALDLAFGHESCARALAILGEKESAANHIQKALSAAEKLEKGDRDYAEREIKNITL
ncbi:MAG: hypothetical protein FWE05_01755 [Defluviitaleaceae bacterium]|nr:hypothetical protein [Defluviitaleaceae bacterium]